MEFFNINNAPISREVTFETKTKATGVGFVTLGQRIRGLLTNNRLDLSGVNTSDDYDDEAKDGKWSDDDKLKYDDSQDFMDKLDVADAIENVSSRLSESIEETVENNKATSNEEKNKAVENPQGTSQAPSVDA